MKILNVNHSSFKKYGKVLKNSNYKEILNVMNNIKCPENVVYEPSVRELENTHDMEILSN